MRRCSRGYRREARGDSIMAVVSTADETAWWARRARHGTQQRRLRKLL